MQLLSCAHVGTRVLLHLVCVYVSVLLSKLSGASFVVSPCCALAIAGSIIFEGWGL